jgi:hypothetical protein
MTIIREVGVKHCIKLRARSIGHARKVVLKLVKGHCHHNETDNHPESGMRCHLPVTHQALVFIGKGDGEVGQQVVHVGALETPEWDITVFTCCGSNGDRIRLGEPRRLLFKEE